MYVNIYTVDVAEMLTVYTGDFGKMGVVSEGRDKVLIWLAEPSLE